MVNNIEIAGMLRKMAAAYTILGENRFKIIAYDNAATAVEHATSELADLWEEGKLDTVSGLGPSIIEHLSELFKTGKSRHFDQVLGKVKPAIFPLLEIPGIGPKKAVKLVDELKLKSIEDLERAAKAHKITGFKKRAIKEQRMVLPLADAIAEEIIEYLAVPADKLGSLRRRVATIGDIDLAVATNEPKKIIDKFVAFPKKVSVIERGTTGASILLASGRQADLRVAKPAEYGAMLQYFTGSKYHNIRLRELAIKKHWSLNEYGISGKAFRTEKDLYNYLGLDYIPPELREDGGEIEAALAKKLPKLVEDKDILGDLQVHTNFDLETSHDSGANSIREVQEYAKRMKYQWVAITDHNPSLAKHTQEQIITRLTKQKSFIEQINASSKDVRVLKMLEVDIQPNGWLPVPQDGLKQLDACLVSIHSSFEMPKKEMTERIIRGLQNPAAKILAHPTGRILSKRDGYEADWGEIMKFCRGSDKALEINAYPDRLDLPDTLVKDAVKMGVKLSIGTDAHEVSQMENMRYGVAVARRGWAEKKNIINTWDYNKLIKWLRAR